MPALVLGCGDGGHVGGPRGGRVLGVQGVGVRASAGGLLVTVHTDISQGAGEYFTAITSLEAAHWGWGGQEAERLLLR